MPSSKRHFLVLSVAANQIRISFLKSNRHGETAAARAVEPRNTPPLANLGMLFTLFWDGRANNMFNGVGVFGMSDIHHDPNKRLIEMDGKRAKLTYLQIKKCSRGFVICRSNLR